MSLRSVLQLISYVGIGLFVVGLVMLGAVYAPSALETVAHWMGFVAVSAFVFGYQIHDFWRFRNRLLFWLTLLALFGCHLAFWVFYVRPHFDGDPRLFTGSALAFAEYVLVSVAMNVCVRFGLKKSRF